MHPKCIPSASQTHPKCIPNASQMHPKCTPNASQMHPKCIPHASQTHPKRIPNASQMRLKCIPNASHMRPKCVYNASLMPLKNRVSMRSMKAKYHLRKIMTPPSETRGSAFGKSRSSPRKMRRPCLKSSSRLGGQRTTMRNGLVMLRDGLGFRH